MKNSEKCRSTSEGYSELATMLPIFHELGALNFDLNRVSKVDNILVVLNEKKAIYHKSCKDKYNQRMHQRLLDKIEKAKKRLLETREESQRPSKLRRSSENRTLVDKNCLFCSNDETFEILHAAGTKDATSTKVNHKHVEDFTEKLKTMASYLQETNVLAKLTSGDVISNELFYHTKCQVNFLNRYNRTKLLENKSPSEKNLDYTKSLALNQIVIHIYENGRSNPNVTYEIVKVENIYKELLKEYEIDYEIDYDTHSTRFAEKLLSRIPELERKVHKNKIYIRFKENDVVKDTLDPDKFHQSVNNVIFPIRKMVSEWKNEFNGKFTETCQQESVPKPLLTLMSLLIDGNDITRQKYSQEALTCSQLVMSNFKKDKHPSKLLDIRYHSKKQETPIYIYNALKLYATVRSETLIDRLFPLGICVSYKRVLEITKNMAYTLIKQFEEEKVILPTCTRKGIFTAIAKDNIDLNSTSTTRSSHYHGTWMSILQFTTKANPGIPIIYKYEQCEQSSLRVESLPKSYASAEKINLSPDADIFAPLSNVNTPEIKFELLDTAVKEEIDWLSLYEIDEHCWSSFHASKGRKNVKKVDISSIMPLIRDKVHTLDTQYHCMKIIAETIKVINPDQTPIDICDQPVFALTKQIQ